MKDLLYKICFTIILVMLGVSILRAQPDEATVRNMVESKQYVFTAYDAIPMEGPQVRLTPQYTFTVSRDTIFAALPYFGRSFTPPANPSNVSIDFITTKFTYKQESKSSGWEITIIPENHPDIKHIYLDIFTNGRTTLRIISINRQNISYNGFIGI